MHSKQQKNMEILKVDPNKPKQADLNKIVATLSKGKIVILPTETVYTFAVDATNKKAIKNVYKIKGRNYDKPLHVVVHSLLAASNYAQITSQATMLAATFLPGPLTLVLKKKKSSLPDLLTSDLPTVGVRIPNLILNNIVSKKFGKPYTTTSANISGGPNPYSIKEVLGQLDEDKRLMISLVVDVGSLPKREPSTLIDLTSKPYKVLRKGPITKLQMEKVLNEKITSSPD